MTIWEPHHHSHHPHFYHLLVCGPKTQLCQFKHYWCLHKSCTHSWPKQHTRLKGACIQTYWSVHTALVINSITGSWKIPITSSLWRLKDKEVWFSPHTWDLLKGILRGYTECNAWPAQRGSKEQFTRSLKATKGSVVLRIPKILKWMHYPFQINRWETNWRKK